VLDWSLRSARDLTDGVVVVVPADVAGEAEPLADVVVTGGATRSASVRAGLDAIPNDIDHVLVHDAARPVPNIEVWRRVIDALAHGAQAVVPVIPVSDTLREVDGGTVDRTKFVAVQTPQGFETGVLRSVHATSPDATDDAALVESIGVRVVTVEGAASNIKITEPWHLAVAEILTR
jgi:2-C-methyl-D-erythritol 4-phosphate cytidylyltransferase